MSQKDSKKLVPLSSLADLTKLVKKTLGKSAPDLIFDPNKPIDFLKSGNIVYDLAIGGFPRRRIAEVFGMESSCKTTMITSAFAEVIKNNQVGVFLDFEGAFDPVYAKETFGVEQDGVHLIIFQPETIEQGGKILDMLFGLAQLDLVAFDSVDAMKPKAMIEADIDTVTIGLQARAMSKFVSKVKTLCQQKNCAAVFTNQMRVNINTSKYEQNVGTGAGFNPMETHTTTGGYSLRFYASQRTKFEYGGQLQDEELDMMTGEEIAKKRVGHLIKIINVKNKLRTPFVKGMTHFEFPNKQTNTQGGWSKALDIYRILKLRGHIQQRGTKFIYKGLNEEWSNIGSAAASKEMFLQDPALQKDAEELMYCLINDQTISLSDNSIKPEDIMDEEEIHAMEATGATTIDITDATNELKENGGGPKEISMDDYNPPQEEGHAEPLESTKV